MKSKLTGLFVLIVGIGLACAACVITGIEPTPKIIMIAAGALCFILGAYMLKQKSNELDASPESDPVREERKYSAKSTVLSQNEVVLYSMLRRILADRAEILPQVALVSIVDKVNYTSYRNELFRIIDFVICDNAFKPLVAVELNDGSHARPDRIERDRKVAEILEKAKLPLVVITVDEMRDFNLVKRKLHTVIR